MEGAEVLSRRLYANARSEDIKCVIPDKRERDEGEGPPFVCVRPGGGGCEQAVAFAKGI